MTVHWPDPDRAPGIQRRGWSVIPVQSLSEARPEYYEGKAEGLARLIRVTGLFLTGGVQRPGHSRSDDDHVRLCRTSF